jgi:hypothetical protein
MSDRNPVNAGGAESRKFDSPFVAAVISLCCDVAERRWLVLVNVNGEGEGLL